MKYRDRSWLLILMAYSLCSECETQTRWMDVSSDGPGHCRAIVTTPDGSIYAGQAGYISTIGGILRSTDHGVSWEHRGLVDSGIEGIAASSSGGLYVAQSYPPRVYRSTNQGDEWEAIGPHLVYALWGIALNLSDDIFLASDQGVYRSTDDGSSWTRSDAGIVDTTTRDVYITGNGDVFVRSYSAGALYRSRDNGDSWVDVSPSAFGSRTTAFTEYQAGTILAATQGMEVATYRSTDYGTSWFVSDSSLLGEEVIDFTSDGLNTIYAVTFNGAFRFDGVLWSQIQYPSSGTSDLAMDSAGRLFGAGAYGIARSFDAGASWHLATRLIGAYVHDMTTSPDNTVHAAANNGVIFRSTDSGESWSTMPISPWIYSTESMAAAQNGDLYAGSVAVVRTTDSGVHWDSLLQTGTTYRRLALGESGLIVVGSSDELWISTDQGSTWGLSLTGSGEALLVLGNDTILAGSSSLSVIYRSSDRGATWSSIPAVGTDQTVTGIAALSSGKILAASNGGNIFSSTDAGMTWEPADSMELPGFTRLFSPDGALVLATVPGAGVYISTDEGIHWEPWASGLEDSTQVNCFSSDSLGYVYAGSSQGVFRTVSPLSSVVPMNVDASWNMVSVPIQTNGALMTSLFPSAISNAFAYDEGYHHRDTLESGTGYWIKFSSGQNLYLDGLPLAIDTIPVSIGWNMIGSIGYSVDVSSIASIPPGIVTSSFFEFAGTYQTTGSLLPGKGYWVKVAEGGVLIIDGSGNIPVTQRIRIEDHGEHSPRKHGDSVD